MDASDHPERIELWPVERLIPYARNARTHSEAQVAQIAASIEEFGWTNPILVDGEGGIIAGHGRLMGARQLGIKEVPVIVLRHLTEEQRRAYVIADNKIALNAGWDEELLALELQGLLDDGFDPGVTGFGEEEIDQLLASIDPERADTVEERPVPAAPEKPVSRLGDLWILGCHRLLCGDATAPEALTLALNGQLADMTFTDPPYNVAYQGGHGRPQRGLINDDLGADYPRFLRAACTNMLQVTKGALYVCMASGQLHTLHQAFTEAGGHWSTFVIWAKNHFTLGRSDYQRQYEPILYGWREGTEHFWCGARDQGDVWFVDKPVANDLHPTMKPVPLVQRALRNSSKSRDTVLDPFAGSGSTVIACEASDRSACVLEIDPAYCDVIVHRWQDLTGDRATLGKDGPAFREIERSRHGH